jgi:hypothetical protein
MRVRGKFGAVRAHFRAMRFTGVWLVVALSGCVARWPASDRASGPCGPGQLKVCGSLCATIVASEGELCSPDVCNARTNPPLVCGAGMSCIPAGTEGEDAFVGTCQRRDALPCDPTIPHGQAGNQCPENLVCVPLGSTLDVQEGLACGPRFSIFGRAPITGLCAAPKLDGEACDSTEAQARAGTPRTSAALCAPCASPLLCWNGTCRRSCDANPQNPGTSGNVNLCRPDAIGSTTNSTCVRNFLDTVTLNGVQRQTAVLCTTCIAAAGAACPTTVRARAALPELNTAAVRTLTTPATRVDPFGVFSTQISAYCPGLPALGTNPICDPTDPGPSDSLVESDPCCGTNVCVNGRCCIPPAAACSNDAQCCTARRVNPDGSLADELPGVCCSAALAAIRPDLCPSANVCATGPVQNRCANDAQCAVGFNCQLGTCTPCGADGTTCCRSGTSCVAGSVCLGAPTNRCATCGAAGNPCCANRACAAGLTCTGPGIGACVAPVPTCGSFGAQCCAGRRCGAGATCLPGGNTCVPCGGASALCCDGGACRQNYACVGSGSAARCQPTCGALGGECCGDGTCTAPATACQTDLRGRRRCSSCGLRDNVCCSDGTPACTGAGQECRTDPRGSPAGRCQDCGQRLQACCAATGCATTGGCVNGACLDCGERGALCCPGNTCRQGAERLVCTGGRCVPETGCGGVGQACCSSSPGCLSDLTCVSGVCRCGLLGQPCCAGTTCLPSGDVLPICVNRICTLP